MRKLLCALLAALLLLTGCEKTTDYSNVPDPVATILLEGGMELRFDLQLQTAPITVANFTRLANRGFYDGMEFYRVVPGVLIQAGSPTNDGQGNAGWTIKGEFALNGVENTLSHTRGVLSMARLPEDYDSGSCIFFIMQGDYPEYDGKYAAFGIAADKATMDAIDRLGSTPVDSTYSPLNRCVIKSIRVDTQGYKLNGPRLKLKKKK